MSYSLEAYKVATYPGINNNPIAPSPEKAGNGSHVIQMHNGQLDEVQGALNNLETDVNAANQVVSTLEARLIATQNELYFSIVQSPAWTVIEADSSCNSRSSLVLVDNLNAIVETPPPVTLSLTLNEQPGDAIELLNASNADWNVDIGQNKYKGQVKPARLYLPANSYQAVKLVYTGFDFGYMPTVPNILQVEV